MENFPQKISIILTTKRFTELPSRKKEEKLKEAFELKYDNNTPSIILKSLKRINKFKAEHNGPPNR